jgi:hypothetical protein
VVTSLKLGFPSLAAKAEIEKKNEREGSPDM